MMALCSSPDMHISAFEPLYIYVPHLDLIKNFGRLFPRTVDRCAVKDKQKF